MYIGLDSIEQIHDPMLYSCLGKSILLEETFVNKI